MNHDDEHFYEPRPTWLGRSARKLALPPSVAGIIDDLDSKFREMADEIQGQWIVWSAKSVLSEPEFEHPAIAHDATKRVVEKLFGDREELVAEIGKEWKELTGRTIVTILGYGAALIMLVGLVQAIWHDRSLPLAKRDPQTVQLVDDLSNAFAQSNMIGRVLVGALAACLVVFAGRMAIKQFRELVNDWKSLWAVVLQAVRPRIRVVINDIANEETPMLLRLDQAPGLGSSAESHYRLTRPEQDRLHVLTRELGASAVAVSGPRGAGKTTLLYGMRDQAGPPFDLIVSVDAPSSYDPREFTMLLHRSICEEVIRAVGRPEKVVLRKLVNFLRKTARVAIFLSILAVLLGSSSVEAEVWLKGLAPRIYPVNDTQLQMYVVGLGGLFFFLSVLRLPAGTLGGRAMLDQAQAELRRLKYLQSVSIEKSGVLKLKLGFDLGRKATRQLVEQAASLPDVVVAYRRFAADVSHWWRRALRSQAGSLIVVIDELDRINDGEVAERFINEIKGVFGVENCTYLVTVSEDALALFERRMVGIRPALDSTFDEVLRLTILRFYQSYGLLARRLVGFPEPFIALCHAMSGGLPRELLRTARSLIDEKRASGNEGLADLTKGLVASDIARLKNGLTSRVADEALRGGSDRLLVFLADEHWPGEGYGEVVAASVELLTKEMNERSDPLVERTAHQLGVSLLFYGTMLETFGNDSFISAPSSDLIVLAESLAGVRTILPTSTRLAEIRLNALRQEMQLLAIPETERADQDGVPRQRAGGRK
ncbi:hypothetical protein [Micromonospora chalcea]|uniref:hypothetical protein n=1 Tax=Micromonospora chalcea TaxID=1874 RepID=UPI0037C7B0FB